MPTGAHGRKGGRPWQRLVAEVIARDAGICWLCGEPGATSGDHVIPLAKGGVELDPNNVRAAHLACNRSRGKRDPHPVVAQLRTSREWF